MQLTLAWPVSPSGFGLFSASSIGAGAQWNSVGVTPVQSGNFYVVTLTLGGSGSFYRLQK